jgi:hypothetical protein
MPTERGGFIGVYDFQNRLCMGKRDWAFAKVLYGNGVKNEVCWDRMSPSDSEFYPRSFVSLKVMVSVSPLAPSYTCISNSEDNADNLNRFFERPFSSRFPPASGVKPVFLGLIGIAWAVGNKERPFSGVALIVGVGLETAGLFFILPWLADHTG